MEGVQKFHHVVLPRLIAGRAVGIDDEKHEPGEIAGIRCEENRMIGAELTRTDCGFHGWIKVRAALQKAGCDLGVNYGGCNGELKGVCRGVEPHDFVAESTSGIGNCRVREGILTTAAAYPVACAAAVQDIAVSPGLQHVGSSSPENCAG